MTLPEPAPFTLDAFLAVVYKECERAWDDDHSEPVITLPDEVLPEVASVVNPITGSVIKIQRVPMFGRKEAGDGPEH